MAGIESRPVDITHPTDIKLDGGIVHPQNVWSTIALNQKWVLQLVLPGYEESAGASVEELVAEADERRVGDDSYTDKRGVDAVEYLFQVPGGVRSVQEEFSGQSVVNVGSGEGVLSRQLMQAGAALVVDIDFSHQALDGTKMPIATGSVDRAVSILSTSFYTDTAQSRVDGLLETLRIVDEGGRALVSPVFANMVRRQMRWFQMRVHAGDENFYDDEMRQYEAHLRKEAAMDFVVTGVIHNLIKIGTIDFTPVLTLEDGPDGKRDVISGIFDIKRVISSDDIKRVSEFGKFFTRH